MYRKEASDADSYGPMLGHHLINVLSPVVGALELVRTHRVAPDDLADILDRAQRKLNLLADAAHLLTSGHPDLALALLAGAGDAGRAPVEEA